MINNINFSNFKTYNQYKQTIKEDKNTKKLNKNIIPLVGSSLGVACGYAATKNVKLDNRILNELLHLLAMAGGANVGSVLLSSIGKKPEQIKKKIHEAGFQVMNTTIPMLMVSAANAICNQTIGKSKPLVRIAASIVGMASGAMLATKITNATNEPTEKERKYTIKDSVANIDDVVATFSIGFEEQAEKLCLDTRLMPFIYAYCGMRAGAKE